MTLLYSSINEQTLDVIDVRERGLAYGDGHFTTATIVDGKIQFLQAHLTRLQLAQSRLKLKPIDWLSLTAHAEQVASAFSHAVIKIVITAGSGGRGYSRVGAEHPNVFVTVSAFPSHYLTWQQKGIKLGLAEFMLSSHSSLSGLKHLNRLEQVMIRQELDARAEQDLLVCDHQGYIVEASSANVFWFTNGRWYTPCTESCGIDGVMRQVLIDHLTDVQVGRYQKSALENVDAMMLTNSVMELVPVQSYQQKGLDISIIHNIQRSMAVL